MIYKVVFILVRINPSNALKKHESILLEYAALYFIFLKSETFKTLWKAVQSQLIFFLWKKAVKLKVLGLSYVDITAKILHDSCLLEVWLWK